MVGLESYPESSWNRSNFSPPFLSAHHQRHTPLGGLKRLGTVMSRRKSVMEPTDTPEKKSRGPFASFRKDSVAREPLPEGPESFAEPDRPVTSSAPRDLYEESVPASIEQPAALEPQPRSRHKPQPPVPKHGTTREPEPATLNSNGTSLQPGYPAGEVCC